jgi:pimeloyl-ACP methyl ester carboxylesterase
MESVPKKSMTLFGDTLSLSYIELGSGRPYLLLHGGAGPATMMPLAQGLSKSGRVIVPSHPGFNAEPRPEWFATIEDLTLAYLDLIDRLDLKNVVVIGNSVGGWIAAEMGLRNSPRIAGTVLLDAVGIDTGSPDKKIVDPTGLPIEEISKLSFRNPAKYAVRPSSPEAGKMMAENQRALRIYSMNSSIFQPAVRARLAATRTPTLIIWGENDGIADKEYGRRFADSIPGARFEIVSEAGHFPHIERLDEVLRLVSEFSPA